MADRPNKSDMIAIEQPNSKEDLLDQIPDCKAELVACLRLRLAAQEISGISSPTERQMTKDETMRPQKGDPPERGLYIAYAVVDDSHPNRAEPLVLEWDGQWLCPDHGAPCKWKVYAWIGPMAVPEAIH
jgi:hypothetical protein